MIRVVELLDSFLTVAATAKPDAVQAIAFGMISLNDREWRRVLNNDRISANEGFVTDPTKLVHSGVCSDTGAIRDLDVARKRRRISHDDVVAKLTVMRHMRLGHQQVVAAYPSYAAAAGS